MNILPWKDTQLGFSHKDILSVKPLSCFLLDISTNCSDPVALMEACGPFAKGSVGIMWPQSSEMTQDLLQLEGMWLQWNNLEEWNCIWVFRFTYMTWITKEKSWLVHQGMFTTKDGFRYSTNFITASMLNY